MSRRTRLSVMILVAGLGLTIFFLFRQAPGEVDLVYDLGPDHAEITGLNVEFLEGARLLRHTEWRFEPGTAPRRVSQTATLPKKEITLRTIAMAGERRKLEERPFDGDAQGREVVVHVAVP